MNLEKYMTTAVLLAGVLTLLATPTYGQSVDQVSRDVGIAPHIGGELPQELRFVDESGATVQLADLLRGKPVILIPVYYKCPMLCGMELNGLVRCMRAMSFDCGDEFDIITYSIDPTEDAALAAEKKRSYVKQYGRESAERGWHFLTGDQASIDRLNESIGFRTRYDEKTGEYAHAACVVIVTPEGTYARYFYGVEFIPRDMRLALVEASNNELSSVTDQVLLLCYTYDPARGKYGFAVMNAVRIGGAATVLAMATFIGRSLWKERSGTASLAEENKLSIEEQG